MTVPNSNLKLQEDLNRMTSSKNIVGTVRKDSNEGLPNLRSLAVDYKNLKDRSRKMRKRFVSMLATPSHEDCKVVLEACIASIETVAERLEDEALIFLGDLNTNEEMKENSISTLHAVWAQKRAHMYLDAVEQVSVDASVVAFQLEMAGYESAFIDAIDMRTSEDDSTVDKGFWKASKSLLVSNWCLPKLVFDVLVGAPAIYYTNVTCKQGLEDSEPSSSRKALRKRANSGLSDAISCKADNKGKGQLPISIQVRPVFEIYVATSHRSVPHGACSKLLPKFAVEIVQVIHENCTHDLAYGDLSLLLALQPLYNDSDTSMEISERSDSNKSNLQVTQARMVQLNAIPPQPHASIDLYTTSVQESEEITIALRLLTKRSHNNEPPHLLIDLLVKN